MYKSNLLDTSLYTLTVSTIRFDGTKVIWGIDFQSLIIDCVILFYERCLSRQSGRSAVIVLFHWQPFCKWE